MTTVTMSLYVSKRFKGWDLRVLFAELSKSVGDDLKIFGFEKPTVEVRDTGICSTGRNSQVNIEGISGLTPEKVGYLFSTIKAVFGSCLPDVIDNEVEIKFDGTVKSD